MINSNFSYYWNSLNDFEFENGKTCSTLSKAGFWFQAIYCYESSAECVFSKLKWEFSNRWNRTNQDALINEMHIWNSHIKMILKEKMRTNSAL